MEKTPNRNNETRKNKKKELHCPECGGVVVRAGKGTNGEFRCPRCKAEMDMIYTGPTLSVSMAFREG